MFDDDGVILDDQDLSINCRRETITLDSLAAPVDALAAGYHCDESSQHLQSDIDSTAAPILVGRSFSI